MSETPIFVTKYALNGGLERQAHKIEDTGYAWYKGPECPFYGSMVTKNDYALTRDEAVKQAEAKKAKKLAFLRKQVAKLEAMTFV